MSPGPVDILLAVRTDFDGDALRELSEGASGFRRVSRFFIVERAELLT
jgi:hypothetical protein